MERSLEGTVPVRRDRSALRAGAAAIFAAGGLGDLLWHEVFGVETGVDALVSPTHLLLLLGGLLGVTAPLRESPSHRPDGWRSALPILGSVTLAAALSAFFLLYLSPFTTDAPTLALTSIPENAPGHAEAEAPAVAGLAAYLVTTAVIVVPVLWLRRHGSLPLGGITLLVAVVATLSAAVTQFEQPAMPVAAVLAGAVADALVHAVRRLPTPVHLPVIGSVIPLLVWSAQLAAVTTGAGPSSLYYPT